MIDFFGNELSVGQSVIFPVSNNLRVGVIERIEDNIVIDTGGATSFRDPQRVAVCPPYEEAEVGGIVLYAYQGKLMLGLVTGKQGMLTIENQGGYYVRAVGKVRRIHEGFLW